MCDLRRFFHFIKPRVVHFTSAQSYADILQAGFIAPSGTEGIQSRWPGSFSIWNRFVSVFDARRADLDNEEVLRQVGNALGMLNEVCAPELVAISISSEPTYGPYRVADIPAHQRPDDHVPKFIPFLEAWFDGAVNRNQFAETHLIRRRKTGWDWEEPYPAAS
jgi:hypothetical protein